MLRLGHIDYSNCLPVHARLLEQPSDNVLLIPGTPGELNAALDCGAIDVAPCSSIEFARHAGRYRVLPGLVIGSQGAVQSIRFESAHPLAALSGREVAVPTASATSVVLLRILLELRYGSSPRFTWFDQREGSDPIAAGASGVLWIGDLALRRGEPPGHDVWDLGKLWTEWTGLPFAFALWQTRLGPERDDELRALASVLRGSLGASLADPHGLAARHAERYGMDRERLARYWAGLQYALDERMLQGLTRYYQLAARLNEIEEVPQLRWVPA